MKRGAHLRTSALWIALLIAVVTNLVVSACARPTKLVDAPAGTATSTPSPTMTPTPTPRFYEVQPGDTLWTIAQRYGVDMQLLAQINELKDPNLLRPGQRLLISDQMTTTVSGRPLPTPTPTPLRCVNGCEKQLPGCEIKGVVARLDGTRLYLLPGDALYPREAADVWFCREEDARRAGWRHWTPYGPAD
ncbi:MAG: LysM peptidoglycan-binding domain-containing protein [Anaerolineae bacterium]|nr:LysM peptidoglycan-binding domain-containing protein [Anaerolineae bacterium]